MRERHAVANHGKHRVALGNAGPTLTAFSIAGSGILSRATVGCITWYRAVLAALRSDMHGLLCCATTSAL
jgi:hypothetical protein